MIDPDLLRTVMVEVGAEVDAAATRSGRDPGAAEILLAGKYLAADEAPALVAAGIRRVGENRLNDLVAKQGVVGDALQFDFIGHLQRRKAGDVVHRVRLIHSVDSQALADELAARAKGPLRVLVEVNIADEPTKHGVAPRDLDRFIEYCSGVDVVVGGLMTLPPAVARGEDSRRWFARLRELRDGMMSRWSPHHDLHDLSMGTTQDFVVAVEEGASIVRVGRGIIDRVRMEP